ncbi:MAG: hypothetical protein LBE97_02795 [Holosporales bacterium]|jgi:hypothetical protein|nr:hypothetical protein [Holosporales bacterium]
MKSLKKDFETDKINEKIIINKRNKYSPIESFHSLIDNSRFPTLGA